MPFKCHKASPIFQQFLEDECQIQPKCMLGLNDIIAFILIEYIPCGKKPKSAQTYLKAAWLRIPNGRNSIEFQFLENRSLMNYTDVENQETNISEIKILTASKLSLIKIKD